MVHTLVDVATLTGACVMALGETVAGVFSNSRALVQQLQRAATIHSEPVWHLPVLPLHDKELGTRRYPTRRYPALPSAAQLCLCICICPDGFLGNN